MGHSQKAKYIVLTCMLAIGLFSAYALWHSFRPSPGGIPYEEATMEQAEEYMRYEKGYILLDVSSAEDFERSHMEGAVNLPYDSLIDHSASRLPDKGQMIYICGSAPDDAHKAAMKLSELGYTNLTLITDTAEPLTEPAG